MPALLADPTEAILYANATLARQFDHVRMNGDTVFFQYLEDPFPLSGYLQISPTLKAVLIRISPALAVGSELRQEALQYLARVNATLAVGAWSLDSDGDLRWKSGFFFPAHGFDGALLDELVASSVVLVRRHIRGWGKVLVGHSADEAWRANPP